MDALPSCCPASSLEVALGICCSGRRMSKWEGAGTNHGGHAARTPTSKRLLLSPDLVTPTSPRSGRRQRKW